jgi:DNA-binding LacI/PurR family transcriptional regulator
MALSDYNIDPDRAAPKYEQVKNILLRYIEALPAGEEYLPYEQVVARELHVGQVTVRRAFRELRELGVIDTVRNRGSKVIRSGAQVSAGQIKGESDTPWANHTVAMLLPRFDPEATSGHRQWRICRAFERLAARESCQVLFYSLADPKWSVFDRLIENLRDNGIQWAYLGQATDFKAHEVAFRLQNRQVKLATLVDSVSAPNLPLLSVLDDVDWVSSNYQAGMYQTLLKNFSEVDEMVYVADRGQLSWAEERMKTVSLFCRERGIAYQDIIGDCGPPAMDDKAVVAAFNPDLRQLFIGANDDIALPVLERIQQLPPEQQRTIGVLGFDDDEPSCERGLSTFIRNEEAIAEAFWTLCRNSFRQPESRRASNGLFVVPLYISRASTQWG